MSATQPFVSVLMGSDSDLSSMQICFDTLDQYGVAYQAKVTSAHRTPEQTAAFVKNADQSGCAVFICAAGVAAHLAGAVAALTVKPVIGVPLNVSLNGLDSLLSTVQMPGGVPVATVAIGKPGAHNAALLAVQILALSDNRLATKLRTERTAMVGSVQAKDAALQAQLQAAKQAVTDKNAG